MGIQHPRALAEMPRIAAPVGLIWLGHWGWGLDSYVELGIGSVLGLKKPFRTHF